MSASNTTGSPFTEIAANSSPSTRGVKGQRIGSILFHCCLIAADQVCNGHVFAIHGQLCAGGYVNNQIARFCWRVDSRKLNQFRFRPPVVNKTLTLIFSCLRYTRGPSGHPVPCQPPVLPVVKDANVSPLDLHHERILPKRILPTGNSGRNVIIAGFLDLDVIDGIFALVAIAQVAPPSSSDVFRAAWSPEMLAYTDPRP